MTIVLSVPLIVFSDCDVHEAISSKVIVRRLLQYDSAWSSRTPEVVDGVSWVALVGGGVIKYDKAAVNFVQCETFGIDVTGTIWSDRSRVPSMGGFDLVVDTDGTMVVGGGRANEIRLTVSDDDVTNRSTEVDSDSESWAKLLNNIFPSPVEPNAVSEDVGGVVASDSVSVVSEALGVDVVDSSVDVLDDRSVTASIEKSVGSVDAVDPGVDASSLLSIDEKQKLQQAMDSLKKKLDVNRAALEFDKCMAEALLPQIAIETRTVNQLQCRLSENRNGLSVAAKKLEERQWYISKTNSDINNGLTCFRADTELLDSVDDLKRQQAVLVICIRLNWMLDANKFWVICLLICNSNTTVKNRVNGLHGHAIDSPNMWKVNIWSMIIICGYKWMNKPLLLLLKH